MNINIKKCTTTISLLAALSLSQQVLSHNDAAYNHDSAAVANNPAWMAAMSGSATLSTLNLPGTHDTMSVKGGDIGENQSMGLRAQLDSGIRALDLRTKHINNDFTMHHGIINQNTKFGPDVLKVISDFLSANPTETVVFRLVPANGDGNTRSYEATLQALINQYGGGRHWTGTSNNPALDDIRGKFVILEQSIAGDWGIDYKDRDLLKIQDDYSLGTNWDLYGKWESVKAHMNLSDKGDRNKLYMNYLSGANGSFPYFVASGHSSNGTSAPRLSTGLTTPGWNSSYPDFPRTTCFIGICTISFEGTNTLTANYIANGYTQFVGMVMADFPGRSLIENVINLNEFEYKELKVLGKCIDVAPEQFGNGANAYLWGCHGAAWQKWKYEPVSGLIRSQHNPNFCLDSTNGNGIGTNVAIYTCDGHINLQWDWVGDSIRPRKNNALALDIDNGQANDGQNLQLWTAYGGAAQQFSYGNYRELKVLGKCIDVAPDQFVNGGNAYLWECNGQPWQKWIHEPSGLIRSKHNPKYCLDSTNDNTSGTSVSIYSCDGNINLKWDRVGTSIRPRKNNNLALDIDDGQSVNGQNLQLWSVDGNTAQQFGWGNR